jgi:DNA-directed RNA polymerase subunit omega
MEQACAGVLGKGVRRRKPIPNFYIAFRSAPANLLRSIFNSFGKTCILNAELTKKALEKVGNPNVLVNLISRRVRQLNAGAGAMSRPLIADAGNLGAADIALTEIIEGKIGFEMPETVELTRPSAKKRGRKH